MYMSVSEMLLLLVVRLIFLRRSETRPILDRRLGQNNVRQNPPAYRRTAWRLGRRRRSRYWLRPFRRSTSHFDQVYIYICTNGLVWTDLVSAGQGGPENKPITSRLGAVSRVPLQPWSVYFFGS
jgi:hypothetical protein